MRGRFIWAVTAAAVASLSACASEPPTALFLGDADTAGTSLKMDEIEGRWPTLVAEQFGWREVNAGCEGSGYTRPGQDCMTTYRERVDRVLEEDPQVIVISGGASDLGATLGEIEAAVHATFVTLAETFPAAKVYAIGALDTNASTAPDVASLNAVIADQAAQAGATYVDLGDALEDRPDLVAADGQPTVEGHAVIAELTSHVIDGS
ncbi:SGNH/GDSL hydrolase family protein [uncultured Demequina sp.]|uniref:SGNH/GDSL hydrolase family protein n=1 Tax=uncultured Demequina sp. TaxID=693499 RepID=UPI0025D2B90E|nr:SGNH/GDSL hydrolase family protein [uncultured Demequina sp.]